MLANNDGKYQQVGRGCLTAAERRLVHTVLWMRTGGPRLSPEQRAILFDICSSSTRHSNPAEEFLVAFKQALFDEADALAIPLGMERNEMISNVISVLIEEMFNPAIIDVSSASTELRSR